MLNTKSIILITCLVQQVHLKYTIISEVTKGAREVSCYSSTTRLDQLLEAWENKSALMGLRKGNCKLGAMEQVDCNLDLMSNYVSNVYDNPHGLGAMMYNTDDDKRIEVLNDQIPDSMIPGGHNCSLLERKPFWADLIPSKKENPRPSLISLVPTPRSDFKRKFEEAEEEMKKIRKELQDERQAQLSVIEEGRKRMRDLEDKLMRQWNEEKQKKGLLEETLEKERQLKNKALLDAHNLDKQLKEKDREFKTAMEEHQNERHRINSNMIRPPITTPAAVILTSLLSASVVLGFELENRNTNHALNRPGNGGYSISDNNLIEAKCMITYGNKCPSWEMQLDPVSYPFFSSNFEKYSLLESISETSPIIGKFSEVCVLSNLPGAQKTCAKEASLIKKQCSDDMRAYFYINSLGKLAIVTCPENNVLSQDCNFCLRKAKGEQYVYKPIQDGFCQNGGVSSVPSIRYSKDICSIGPTKVKNCHKGTSRYERTAFISTGDKKVYLEEIKIRSRQEYEPDQFLCYKVKDSSSSPLAYEKVQVSKCKGIETNSPKKCTGDEYFCSKYPCESTSPEANCFLRKHSAILEVNIGGMWIKPKCIGYEMALVKRVGLRSEDVSSKECATCLWECSSGYISITTHGPKISYATACSHGSCKSIVQNPSTSIRISYPGNSEIVGGDIGIHLTEDSSPINLHLKIHCSPKDSCEVSDCIFCVHGLLNYQCHSVASALLLSTITASLIVLMIYMLSKTKFVMKKLIPIMLTPLCWCFVLLAWLTKSWKGKMRNAIQSANSTIGWTEREERIVAERPRSRNTVRYSFYGVVILAMLESAFGCSESLIAESKVMQCNIANGKTSCRASGTIIMKLGPIGSEACLILKGLRDSDKQYISVKTESSELICREGESFWTSLYTPVCLSSRRCHLMGECTGDLCLKWKSNKTSLEFAGKTRSDVINENKCFEQSGGLGYGCFNVNPSCLYTHAYLKSVYRNGFRVFKCASWTHRVKLTITTHSRTFPMTLAAMSTQPTDWGSIGLILDSEGISGTNSFSFMKHGLGSFAIIDEPYSMEPRKGFIGEVRCPTEEAAIKASTLCKTAPQLIEYQPEMDSAECTTNMIDPMSVFNRGSLPQVREGMTFTQSMEKNTVQAMTTGEVHASIRIVLDDYEVEYLSSQVDCDATFKNLTGCYSCDEGARVCMQIIAHGDTIFHFRNPDVSINILQKVNTNTLIYCSVVHFSKPVIKEEGTYDCGAGEKPMILKGTLVAVSPHNDRLEQGGSSIVINPKGGGVDFLGWLSGFSSWFGGPLKAILMVIGFLLLGLILFVTIAIGLKFALRQMIVKRMK
uniref:Envelopment polyprotein n=2 Tax=Viruses TaxID=10239 RepID=R4I381_9VIRU|nr:polyprotein [Naples virus]